MERRSFLNRACAFVGGAVTGTMASDTGTLVADTGTLSLPKEATVTVSSKYLEELRMKVEYPPYTVVMPDFERPVRSMDVNDGGGPLAGYKLKEVYIVTVDIPNEMRGQYAVDRDPLGELDAEKDIYRFDTYSGKLCLCISSNMRKCSEDPYELLVIEITKVLEMHSRSDAMSIQLMTFDGDAVTKISDFKKKHSLPKALMAYQYKPISNGVISIDGDRMRNCIRK